MTVDCGQCFIYLISKRKADAVDCVDVKLFRSYVGAVLLYGIANILYNTYFSRGGHFRYIREFGFCAKFSSREINIQCAWNFAKFSSREIFLPRNFPPANFSSTRKLNTNSDISP